MTTPEVLSMVALVVGIAGGLVVHGRWQVGRLDEFREETQRLIAEANGRIDRLTADYVRKDDLMQHIARIEHAVERIGERLDRVISDALTALGKGRGGGA